MLDQSYYDKADEIVASHGAYQESPENSWMSTSAFVLFSNPEFGEGSQLL